MSRYRRSSAPGATYFFTVALADRSSSVLTDRIGILRRHYGRIQRQRPFHTVAICILPDHLHAIWEMPPGDGDFSSRWRQIKSGFARHFPASPTRSASKITKREKGIWQRRFWEHQIRDERDLERHVDYVHFNPVKHGLVGKVVDWPCSSFHRYLRQGILSPDWAGDAGSKSSVLAGEPG